MKQSGSIPHSHPEDGFSSNGHHGHRHVHGDHHVQFYETEEYLCEAVSRFVHQGLMDGLPIVMLATESHWRSIGERLGSAGYDINRACRSGQIISQDATEALSSFMVGGMPDEMLFNKHVGGLIEHSLRTAPRVQIRAYGEMVDVLWREGNSKGALRLEELWNDLAQTYSFSLLCSYAMGHFYKESHARDLEAVCARHARVIPAETYTPNASDDSRAREILMLQQKARSLEAEIEHRMRLETALREALLDRRKAEEAARKSERELRDFLESAVEGLHWVGPDGVILWANRAEMEMLGYTADEYVGHHIAEFHADQRAIKDILTRLARGEQLIDFEVAMRAKDGSIRYILLNSNVLFENGEFVHTRCFSRDITGRRNAEQALRRAKEEAERASRVKSEFLAVMSHELRTPLNALMGYHDLLVEGVGGPLTDAQREYLERMRVGSDQLTRLIDQVLSLSRIEAGREDVSITNLDLAVLIREAVDLVAPIAAKKELTLSMRTDADSIPCTTDAGKVQQILLNLLSNALKFTRQGSIDVHAAIADDIIRIDVVDTGMGIDSEELSRIFEPFVQLSSTATREQGGSGLGLSVSYQLARLLGGDLRVTSEVGRGSVFSLQLPAAAPMPAARPVAHAHAKL